VRETGYKRGRRHRPRTTWLFLLLLCCGAPFRAVAAIHLLLADDTPYYRETAISLQHHLRLLVPEAVVSVHTQMGSWPEEDTLVSIGSQALTEIRAGYPERTALHLFVTSDFWREQSARDPDLGHNTTVVIDQPPRRLLTLARLLVPGARALSVVLGPISHKHGAVLDTDAAALGFESRIGVLKPGNNPIATLSPLINAAQVVVVLPDSADFNRAVAKWLLQLSFRARIPVIGFSRAYTDAGALASVYSTPENIGQQGAELVAERLTRGLFPPGMQHPRYYNLATNAAVADALGIVLPTAAVLRSRYAAALPQQ
jgi:putative ABC transport system substrate-binding protein